jgi:hypothetical protein
MSFSNGGSTTIKSAEIESIVWDHVKSQLELKGIQWIPARFNQLNSVNSRFNCSEDKRKKILRILGLMSNDLLNKNRDFLRSKCETVIERLDQLNSDQLDALGYISFCEIADALFSKGIRWNHILVLFVFSVELSFIYSRIKDNLLLIDKVTDWLLQYLSDRLLVWINNNNGWVS